MHWRWRRYFGKFIFARTSWKRGSERIASNLGVAADAWTACRSDPATFGTINGNLRGLWFIAANLVHHIAALNKMEMLRWDVWGAMPHPDTSLTADDLAFFDYLTALTREPGESFEELRRLYEDDDRLRVPSSVLNALRNRPESTLSPAP